MKAKVLLCIAVCAFTMGQQCSPEPDADEELIFTNSNSTAVSNNPTSATTFTLSRNYNITRIQTYHWNNGSGTSSPGSIRIQASDGTTFGPFTCSGISGQGGVPNATWECTAETVLGVGNYTILDSDPTTWSCNTASGKAGFAWVYGIKTGGDAPDGGILTTLKRCSYVSFSFKGRHTLTHASPPQPDSTISRDLIVTSNSILAGDGSTTYAPITWNGNTFMVDYDDGMGKRATLRGTVSADGQSITQWEGYQVRFSVTDRLVGTTQPLPLVDSNALGVQYKLSGPAVKSCLSTVSYTDCVSGTCYSYTGTDYTSTETPAEVACLFFMY